MNNRQNGRRRRGGGNQPRPMGMQGGGQGGNRLEVRVRGNAHQLLEKYKQLARDAHQGGDRVAAEYYLQHADHYFRVLNDSRIRQEEMRARRGIFDPLDEEGEEEEEVADAGSEAARFDDRREQRGFDDRRTERPPEERRDQPRSDERRPVRNFEERRTDQALDGGDSRDPWSRNRDRPRRNREERPADRAEEVPLSDGEAALVAFGGRPAETSAEQPPLPEAGEAEPRPRRRTRTRRTTEAETVEG